MRELLIISGGSGVGKSTLENKLIEVGIVPVDIYTDREKRGDDNEYYHFIETSMFEYLAAEIPFDFFFHTEVNDRRYGYSLPESEGRYVVSFIYYLNAVHFANLARKHGFNVTVANMVHDESTGEILDKRNNSDVEKENRIRLMKEKFDISLLHKDIRSLMFNRENGFDVAMSCFTVI